MSGAIGLHGGQEYTAGDEPFLDQLLAAARVAARRRGIRERHVEREGSADVAGHGAQDADRRPVEAELAARWDETPPIRVVILPTAGARGLPERAGANGRAAFERRAAVCDWPVTVEVALVVDASSAADPEITERLREADLIHLPGGDPDLVPRILAGSPALEAIRDASSGGAVLAGASAGAMGLAEWTWTPSGGLRGLGLVPGVAVVPHYDDIRRTAWQATLDRLAPGGLGYLGLDERTGVLRGAGGPRTAWRVAGAGAAWWFGRGGGEPLVGRDGDELDLPI
jgi:cyanophycinase-like exopeptidase